MKITILLNFIFRINDYLPVSYIHSTSSNPIKSNGLICRYIQRWGRFRGVISSAAPCINIFRGPLLVFPHCGPRRSSHHKSPVRILSGGISGQIEEWASPTVPHDNPPARPLRFFNWDRACSLNCIEEEYCTVLFTVLTKKIV